ncbi:unnamed protein product [Pleuronectes platessa]|uniref:Uncharacterized protein n=1 Tax=Pleuronectes platessa TaxID=8262 RepID=A0A9N7Y5E9_PLEPL|nr:unnamed protein product [Pleuronectes platessa]
MHTSSRQVTDAEEKSLKLGCASCSLSQVTRWTTSAANYSTVSFDDHILERPLLADRPSPLHMDIDSSPDIQAEHSYSLSEDSAPQSPALSIKMDQESGRSLDIFRFLPSFCFLGKSTANQNCCRSSVWFFAMPAVSW